MTGRTTRRWLATLVFLALALGTDSRASAQSYAIYGAERYFHVDSTLGQNRRGRPTLDGYVYNDYGTPAMHVRLLVEGLDAGGQVVESKITSIPGSLSGGGRSYFEQPVEGKAASYRIKVLSFDFIRAGG